MRFLAQSVSRVPCITIGIAASLFVGSFLSCAAPVGTNTIPDHKIKIVLVGDSTVTDAAGWGLGFKHFVNEQAQCVNRAVGGRSSMSFIEEARWEKALALKGEYYLIQFGHNDQPGKPGVSTEPDKGYRDYMTRYVDEARAISAKPILVTPLVRREFDRMDPHKINSRLEPYVNVVKDIAAQKDVPLVDLHARSKALCESLGREKCLEFSPSSVRDGKTNYDGTHLNAEGGILMAKFVVDELRKICPELSACLRSEPGPVAPPKIYLADDFGAKGDGKTLDSPAIQRTLDVCGQAGGGIVRITPGTYLCRPIFMRCNTNLRLDAGAKLQATDDPMDFAVPAHPGATLALVNAIGLNAVAITGNGIIDGAGRRWWDDLKSHAETGHPGSRSLPPLVVFSNCVDMTYEDVTLQNAPDAHLVAADCENVSISGTVFETPKAAPKTDAIVLNASRYVTIHDCLMIVGGAGIAIKSDHLDRAHPNGASEHITIKDAGFLRGNGLCIGCEIQGGVHNLGVSNCSFNGTDGGICIESGRGIGGRVANVTYQNLKMSNVDSPIRFTCLESRGSDGDGGSTMASSLPVYHDINIENVTATGAQAAGEIIGLPQTAISNVLFKSVTIAAAEGMTLRNARGIEFENSEINVTDGASLNVGTNVTVTGLPAK